VVINFSRKFLGRVGSAMFLMFIIFDSMHMVEQDQRIQGQQGGDLGRNVHDVARKAAQLLNMGVAKGLRLQGD